MRLSCRRPDSGFLRQHSEPRTPSTSQPTCFWPVPRAGSPRRKPYQAGGIQTRNVCLLATGCLNIPSALGFCGEDGNSSGRRTTDSGLRLRTAPRCGAPRAVAWSEGLLPLIQVPGQCCFVASLRLDGPVSGLRGLSVGSRTSESEPPSLGFRSSTLILPRLQARGRGP